MGGKESFYSTQKNQMEFGEKSRWYKGSLLLEWEPEFELEYGIEKTINWYKEKHGR